MNSACNSHASNYAEESKTLFRGIQFYHHKENPLWQHDPLIMFQS